MDIEERIEMLEGFCGRLADKVQTLWLKYEMDLLAERRRDEDLLCKASEELSKRIMAAREVVEGEQD